MALPKTGYTKDTANNFIIDAGMIFTDISYSDTDGFSGTPLGATSGGVSVNIEQSMRRVEVDSAYIMPVMGLNVMESANCTVTANLKELTAENLRLAINGTMEDADETEAPDGYKKITTKRYIEEGDYIPSVAIVGTHSGTKEPVIFMLDNGLVTSALEMATTDNNEATIEVTIQANASYDQLAADEFPWRIYHPGNMSA